MPVPPPTPETRWRCGACGNLTRFDVVRTRRLREYVHADLAGAPVVEESEVLGDVVEHVTCRWCGAVDQVDLVPRPDAASPGAASPGAASPGAASPGAASPGAASRAATSPAATSPAATSPGTPSPDATAPGNPPAAVPPPTPDPAATP